MIFIFDEVLLDDFKDIEIIDFSNVINVVEFSGFKLFMFDLMLGLLKLCMFGFVYLNR